MSMLNMKTTLSLLPLMLAPLTHAICNPGEIGVGITQMCQLGDEDSGGYCGAEAGQIWDNNCNLLASTSDGGFCQGGWDNDYTVACAEMTDISTVGIVLRPDVDHFEVYDSCYSVEEKAELCGDFIEGIAAVYYCCAIPS